MGAVLNVPFARGEWADVFPALRSFGFTVVALTPEERAEPIDRFVENHSAERLALVLGNEGAGLSAAAAGSGRRPRPHPDQARRRLPERCRRRRHRVVAIDAFCGCLVNTTAVLSIPVEFASQRKVRTRNKLVLPVQPLASLDLGLFHIAGPADLRPVRARIRLAHPVVAGGRDGRDRDCGACRAAARHGSAPAHRPLHRRLPEPDSPEDLLHDRVGRALDLHDRQPDGACDRRHHGRVAPQGDLPDRLFPAVSVGLAGGCARLPAARQGLDPRRRDTSAAISMAPSGPWPRLIPSCGSPGGPCRRVEGTTRSS